MFVQVFLEHKVFNMESSMESSMDDAWEYDALDDNWERRAFLRKALLKKYPGGGWLRDCDGMATVYVHPNDEDIDLDDGKTVVSEPMRQRELTGQIYIPPAARQMTRARDNALPAGQCWFEYIGVDGEYRRRPVKTPAPGEAFTLIFVTPSQVITHQNCLACRVGDFTVKKEDPARSSRVLEAIRTGMKRSRSASQ